MQVTKAEETQGGLVAAFRGSIKSRMLPGTDDSLPHSHLDLKSGAFCMIGCT